MFVNPSAERSLYSLTFLGKKVGRHHSVAPAGKQRAWELTATSSDTEDALVSSRPRPVPEAALALEDLPGSVPELRDHRPRPLHHNRNPLFDESRENAAAAVFHKTLWMKRWTRFSRWISVRRRKRAGAELDRGGSQISNDPIVDADKIYIPYESAELCISQITDDMEAMRRRHLRMVQELEEDLRITARDKQKWTVQRIRSHYQTKLNMVRKILDTYQEKVEKKNGELEKKAAALTALNQQLQEELRSERSRSKEESLQWQREKSKMLEAFSNRLDLLHGHQASTLQELQLARQEVGNVQEMLTASLQQQQQQQEVVQSMPLEGATARLEELKESLYQREREITELLESEKSLVPLFPRPSCTLLLTAVILKAHLVCGAVTESTALLDKMIEENHSALVKARDKLERLQMKTEETTDPERRVEEESSLSSLQDTVRECELYQVALDCIRSGESPETNDSDAVLDLEDILGPSAVRTTEGVKSVGQQLLFMQDQLKQMKEESKKIIENYTSERTMRTRFYNMVEEMKGKIRVFCRIRPLSRSEATQGDAAVVNRIDEFSVKVETSRGPREFQFDKVFNTEASQTDLFVDVSRLVQSAIDGYNVCIFAYGQTGSGKTFTMVGDKEQKNPGIIPRTFNAIFDIIADNRTKFDVKVSVYMLELYNDRLQDLLVSTAAAGTNAENLQLKRNRGGAVVARGAERKEASSAQELYVLFRQASSNRRISATKMNVESSRSHLIVGITVESRNLTNGSVSTGKLSLVDLAGSERAAKTGAKDHQLKEANSINKSLSALGDVISALSAELPHVPYRNSKLTQVMRDSLGGNAKTLMIVNISPSECNLDETLTSLIYATRVKNITNNAQRNVESKEVAHLKEVIMKLKSGQTVEEEDEDV